MNGVPSTSAQTMKCSVDPNSGNSFIAIILSGTTSIPSSSFASLMTVFCISSPASTVPEGKAHIPGRDFLSFERLTNKN